MAKFYTGYRPVLKGRNRKNMVHPTRGVGNYSNWSLYSTDHVLDGAPDSDVDPGTGLYPHGLQLSRWFTGLRDKWPLDGSGGGNRIDGMRYRPLEYKGTGGQGIFSGTWGHVDRVTNYSQWDAYIYNGVASGQVMTGVGHIQRQEGNGGTGAYDPYEFKGFNKAYASTFGQAVPAGYDNSYGHNRVKEWRGVASSNALGNIS